MKSRLDDLSWIIDEIILHASLIEITPWMTLTNLLQITLGLLGYFYKRSSHTQIAHTVPTVAEELRCCFGHSILWLIQISFNQ